MYLALVQDFLTLLLLWNGLTAILTQLYNLLITRPTKTKTTTFTTTVAGSNNQNDLQRTPPSQIITVQAVAPASQPPATVTFTNILDPWERRLVAIERENAILALRSLKQGKMTCEAYTDLFYTYYEVSGYNEVAGLEEYKRGLNRGLRRKLLTTFPQPEDNPDGSVNLDNWVERARGLDRVYRRWRWLREREREREMMNGEDRNTRMRRKRNARQQRSRPSDRESLSTGYLGWM